MAEEIMEAARTSVATVSPAIKDSFVVLVIGK
jgi:hypothetical protein